MTDRHTRPDGTPPELVLCPDGPMLVRGAAVVIDEDGARHPTSRPVSAVCRCGATARAPWCDGSHQVIAARKRAAERLD